MFNCGIFYEIVVFYLQASTFNNYPYTVFASRRPWGLALINRKELCNRRVNY